jgi:hypothetical protein
VGVATQQIVGLKANVLRSLWKYYVQFEEVVEETRERMKAGIEKKVKGEVKLARWDDQNYYALAETTEKNHRKLNKFLREYDEVLNLGVGDVLQQYWIKGVREANSGGEERGAIKVPSNSEIFGSVVREGGEVSVGGGAWVASPPAAVGGAIG